MSDLPLVSASQINKYRDCPRAWAWSYLAKIRQPQAAAAALGTEVDDIQLQPYMRANKPLDLSRPSGLIAQTALPFLPKPMTAGLEIQKHFLMASPRGGYGYQGYMDMALPDSKDMPGCAGGVPLVSDFKTTKWWKFIKTPEDLKKDVQAQLYAMNALVESGARAVDLVWLFMHTETPYKAKPIFLRVDADHVGEQFAAIDATAAEMYDVRQRFIASGLTAEQAEPFVKSLPPTASTCGSYGGCFYRSRCNLSPKEIDDSLTAERKRRLPVYTPSEVPMAETSTFDLLAGLKVRAEEPAAPSLQLVPTPLPVQLTTASDVGIPHPEVAAVEALTQKKIDTFVFSIDGVPALGINPPEAALPPPPCTPPEPEEPKAAKEAKPRGRPKGAKKDPVGADVAAHTGGGDVVDNAIDRLVAEADALLDENDFRREAVIDFTRTIGNAFFKLSDALRVSK